MGRRSKWDQSGEDTKGGEEQRGREKERSGDKDKEKEKKGVTKKTRWASHASKTFVPGVPTFVPNCLSKQELDALLLRVRIEEIGYKIATNQYDSEYYRARSPSPTPVYDTLGRRVNTKDQRAKNKLENERAYLIEKATKIHPLFKPPVDFKTGAGKRTKKIYIPVQQFPDYNFVGLIIGPRGLTQKQLEKETGAKIVIRGKGSVKTGRQSSEEEQDDLHVLISADTPSQIKAAARAVKKLLVPVEEGKNVHKMQQLRQLAEINGTLHDAGWQPRTWRSADVYCKHCGDLSHPTSDCPLKNKPVDKQAIEKDYEKFMNEIGMDASATTAAGSTEVEQSYDLFMASLTGAPAPPTMPSAPKPPVAAPAVPTPAALAGQPQQPWSQGYGGYGAQQPYLPMGAPAPPWSPALGARGPPGPPGGYGSIFGAPAPPMVPRGPVGYGMYGGGYPPGGHGYPPPPQGGAPSAPWQ